MNFTDLLAGISIFSFVAGLIPVLAERSVTVDGGKDYIRRGFKKIEDLEDLSICVYYLSDPQDKRLLEIEKNPRKPYKTKKLRDFL